MFILDVPTDAGRKTLGKVLKAARLSRDWSIDDLVTILCTQVVYRSESGNLVSYHVSKGTISGLENGQRSPRPLLLEAIAAVGYVQHPLTRCPYKVEELKAISYEQFDPKIGNCINNASSQLSQSRTLASQPVSSFVSI